MVPEDTGDPDAKSKVSCCKPLTLVVPKPTIAVSGTCDPLSVTDLTNCPTAYPALANGVAPVVNEGPGRTTVEPVETTAEILVTVDELTLTRVPPLLIPMESEDLNSYVPPC